VSRDLVKVAVLGKREQIGSESFASMVARNRGLNVQAFVDRAEAVAWLLKPPA